jgi:hypothetical protein
MNNILWRRVRRGTDLIHTPTGRQVVVLKREGGDAVLVRFANDRAVFIATRRQLAPYDATQLRK